MESHQILLEVLLHLGMVEKFNSGLGIGRIQTLHLLRFFTLSATFNTSSSLSLNGNTVTENTGHIA